MDALLCEYSTIGALLIDPEAYPEAAELRPDDFLYPAFAAVFRVRKRPVFFISAFIRILRRTDAFFQVCNFITSRVKTRVGHSMAVCGVFPDACRGKPANGACKFIESRKAPPFNTPSGQQV